MGDLIVLLGLLLAVGAGLVAGAVAVGRGTHRPRRLDRIVTAFGVWALGLPVWFLLGAGSITVRGLGTVSMPGGLADLADAFVPVWMAVYPVLVAWAAWPFGDLMAHGLWASASGLAAVGVLGAAIGVGSPYTGIPTVFGLMLVGLAWAIVREWLPVELTDQAAPSD